MLAAFQVKLAAFAALLAGLAGAALLIRKDAVDDHEAKQKEKTNARIDKADLSGNADDATKWLSQRK